MPSFSFKSTCTNRQKTKGGWTPDDPSAPMTNAFYKRRHAKFFLCPRDINILPH